MTGIPSSGTVTRLGRDDARWLFQIARDGIQEEIVDCETRLLRDRVFADDPIPDSLSEERSRSDDALECESKLARLREMLNVVLWSLDALAQKTPDDFAETFAEFLKEPPREVH